MQNFTKIHRNDYRQVWKGDVYLFIIFVKL